MEFNFDNAFMHFARTGAPRGFVWKYALSYVALTVVMGLLGLVVAGGWYVSLLQAYASQDPAQILDASQMSAAMMAFIYLVLMPLSLLFYAVFETSYLRRYMRQERFYLRLGQDEFRVFVVLLIWMLYFFAATILLSIVTMIILIPLLFGVNIEDPNASLGMAFIFGVVMPLLMFIPMGLVAIRFAPAAAMTVRDKRIRFLSAWTATKGKFWTLLGTYAAWFLIGFVAYIIALMVLIGIGAASMGSTTDVGDNPTDVLAAVGPFTIIAYLSFVAAGACFYYIWAGPAALVAKVDTETRIEAERSEDW